MSQFRIQIERLDARPKRFRFEVAPGWWKMRQPEGGSDGVGVETPFYFQLEASRAGEDVVIEGSLTGEVVLECSRCAKRYPHGLREPLRLVLEPLSAGGRSGGVRPLDPEGEKGLADNGVCLGEDLELGAYRGPVVGLDEFFGEVIALAMPIQPLCDEDCPGICPHCGAERSNEPGAGCGCEDERIESPFAVLAKLRTKNE